MSQDRKLKIGFIAQGRVAVGIVAIGGVSIGVVALGGLSIGVIALGGVSIGVLALGGIALGGKVLGGLTFSVLAGKLVNTAFPIGLVVGIPVLVGLMTSRVERMRKKMTCIDRASDEELHR